MVFDPMVTSGNAGNRIKESGTDLRFIPALLLFFSLNKAFIIIITGVREVLEKEAGSRMQT